MSYLLLLLAISFAVSAVGWIYFIYFFSIGYGFSISALAVASAILFYDQLTLPAVILLGTLSTAYVWRCIYCCASDARHRTRRFSTSQPIPHANH